MAEHRPFAPSARRRARARAAGLTAASPVVVGAVAWIGALAAITLLGRAAALMLGARVADACRHAAEAPEASSHIPTMASLVREILGFVLPVLIAAALAAAFAHVAQTRGVWLPRRTLRDAPVLEPARTAHAGLAVLGAIAIGTITFAWLWAVAPRLAALVETPLAGAGVLAAFLATLAIAWIALGTLDAVLRHADLTRSLRMTAADKREDDRLAGADPRWRARRAALARGPLVRTRDAVAGASVVLLADDAAVAIAWDPVHRPVPVRTAAGRGAHATQLVALARRHGIPVHRDPSLVASLAADGRDGPVPETHWARLAEIIAATARRTGSI